MAGKNERARPEVLAPGKVDVAVVPEIRRLVAECLGHEEQAMQGIEAAPQP